MERLHDMLTTYNANIPTDMRTSWSKQFLQPTFPSYWEITYKVLQFIDREKRIIEIGAGQGDVTAIACYLGFDFISAYERNIEAANIGKSSVSYSDMILIKGANSNVSGFSLSMPLLTAIKRTLFRLNISIALPTWR